MRNFIAQFVLIMLLLISRAAFAEEITPLPPSITVGDVTYRIEKLPGSFDRPLREPWHGPGSKLVEAIPGARLAKLLDDDLKYWFGHNLFLAPKGGRYAVASSGHASFVACLDLESGKMIRYDEHFPPTGETRGGNNYQTRYEWTTTIMPGDKEDGTPQAWMFVRRWNREKRERESHLVVVPLDRPDQPQVMALDRVIIEVVDRADRELLCRTNNGWLRLSTDDRTILAQSETEDRNLRVGHATYSPDGSEIYAVSSFSGLIVYDVKTGKEKARFGRDGRYVNAASLGATFDPTGRVAAVATPYASVLTLIDTKTHEIIARYKTPVPPGGLLFNAEKKIAYLQGTALPYE